MTFKKILQLSFVHRDPTGLYLDPVFKRALLARLGPEKTEKLRSKIHTFALAESSYLHHSPINWLNTLFTLAGDNYPQRLFNETPPGVSINRINQLPSDINKWSTVASLDNSIPEIKERGHTNKGMGTHLCEECPRWNVPDINDLLPHSNVLAIAEDGEIHAVAALCEINKFPSLLKIVKHRSGNAKVLWYLAHKIGMDWSVSCLIRHILVENMMKANILIANPLPDLALMLDSIGAARLQNENIFRILNFHTTSFQDWLRQMLSLSNSSVPDKAEIVNATRKTLLNWQQTGILQQSPLFLMYLNQAGIPASKADAALSRFEKLVAETFKAFHAGNPRMARILDVIYVRRSSTVRKLSNELNIPERTLYRELQKTLCEIGQNILTKLKGGNNSEQA